MVLFFIEEEIELVGFGQGDPRDFVVHVLLSTHLLRRFPVQEVERPLLFQLCQSLVLGLLKVVDVTKDFVLGVVVFFC